MQGQLQDKGYYPEGRLYVTKTTDENGNESYEFKNIAGNVILKRTICSIDEAADTYYIYDYRGNLAFVLPPNYQEGSHLTSMPTNINMTDRGIAHGRSCQDASRSI